MPEKTVSREVDGPMVHAGCSRRPPDGQGQEAPRRTTLRFQARAPRRFVSPCVRGHCHCSPVNRGLASRVKHVEESMKRVAPWVLIVATLTCVGCAPFVVESSGPVGPGYEPGPPPPGYGQPEVQVYVARQPPPPAMEYPTPAPGPGYSWISGYWDWTGNDWFWVGGYWTPARAGFIYVAPRYVVVGGRPVYERGYWHDHQGHRDYFYGRPEHTYRGSPPPGRPTVYGSPPPGPGHHPGGAFGSPPPGPGHHPEGAFGSPPPGPGHHSEGAFGSPPPAPGHHPEGAFGSPGPGPGHAGGSVFGGPAPGHPAGGGQGPSPAAPAPGASHSGWRPAPGNTSPAPAAPAPAPGAQNSQFHPHGQTAAPAPAPSQPHPAAGGSPKSPQPGPRRKNDKP